MIKTLLILVLALALAGGAALSRPTEADFKQFVHDRIAAKSTSSWDKMFIDSNTQAYLNKVIVKNRVLWTDVTMNGQPEYTGAFAHWFDRTKIAAEVKNVESKAGK